MPPKQSPKKSSLICEIAWEVCQQLGGIYTVIRSKAPEMMTLHGKRYCLIGPYNPQTAAVEFEETPVRGPFGRVLKWMAQQGFKSHHGIWLVSGRPRVILFEIDLSQKTIDEIKFYLWKNHKIETHITDSLLDNVLAFGHVVDIFFEGLSKRMARGRPIVAHFHEWMAGSAIPEMRRKKLAISTVFTTHATLLGRYLAMQDSAFYDQIGAIEWRTAARQFNISARVEIERAASHGAHVFTTVSDITALECKHLLGREPHLTLPNGLNVERFVDTHESQNLHGIFKDRIHRFVMGHFFPGYSFDLDHTVYFFTSGRYEYRNKGFDLTIESLARLNWKLKQAGSKITVVAFFITKQSYKSINSEALANRAVLEEMHRTCGFIQEQIGERLFTETAMGRRPSLDALVDEYWTLRLRRTLLSWKTGRLPSTVTHDLTDPHGDEIYNQLKVVQLLNRQEDPVKVIYHPDFITASSPLFAMDYDHFVRGCHLGIFPSYYEPWGYTPLECIARGIPAITSDLSGFGSFLPGTIPDHEDHGIFILQRRGIDFMAAAENLADLMYQFTTMDRRERIFQRSRVEQTADKFDWSRLIVNYKKAHDLALKLL